MDLYNRVFNPHGITDTHQSRAYQKAQVEANAVFKIDKAEFLINAALDIAYDSKKKEYDELDSLSTEELGKRFGT